MGADDGVPTPVVLVHVGHVHGTAEAQRAARLLAEQLGHDRLGVDPAGNGHAVVAVGRDQSVLRPTGGRDACADGLLPNVEMQKAADLSLLIELGGTFFDAADEYHLMVHPQQVLLLHRHLLASLKKPIP